MTPIGVKLREIRNLYVLIAFAPGSGKRIFLRRESRRPMPLPRVGEVLRKGRKRVRVVALETRVERPAKDVIEHVTVTYTRAVPKKRARRTADAATNVVRMPTGDGSMVAEFLRYHVLVRVFDGDPDAWLAHIRARGGSGGRRALRALGALATAQGSRAAQRHSEDGGCHSVLACGRGVRYLARRMTPPLTEAELVLNPREAGFHRLDLRCVVRQRHPVDPRDRLGQGTLSDLRRRRSSRMSTSSASRSRCTITA